MAPSFLSNTIKSTIYLLGIGMPPTDDSTDRFGCLVLVCIPRRRKVANVVGLKLIGALQSAMAYLEPTESIPVDF